MNPEAGKTVLDRQHPREPIDFEAFERSVDVPIAIGKRR
jgi:hypothetical protein